MVKQNLWLIIFNKHPPTISQNLHIISFTKILLCCRASIKCFLEQHTAWMFVIWLPRDCICGMCAQKLYACQPHSVFMNSRVPAANEHIPRRLLRCPSRPITAAASEGTFVCACERLCKGNERSTKQVGASFKLVNDPKTPHVFVFFCSTVQ